MNAYVPLDDLAKLIDTCKGWDDPRYLSRSDRDFGERSAAAQLAREVIRLKEREALFDARDRSLVELMRENDLFRARLKAVQAALTLQQREGRP